MDYSELVKSLRICAIWKDEIRFPGKDGCNGCAYHDEERDVCTSWDADKLREHIMLDAADAIEELSKPRWIPVTERLPNQYDGLLYICLIVGGEYDQLSWYELCDFAEGRFWTMESESECHVTHWMPLPKSPKEET